MLMRHLNKLGLLFLLTCNPLMVSALTFQLPTVGNDIVGQPTYAKTTWGDNFHTIARRYDMGMQELIMSNPKQNPEKPGAWSKILVPSVFVLPPMVRQGIVINLAEMRLYYYPVNASIVVTYPVGIGQSGWQTPQGELYIKQKIKDPTWHVPESIQQKLLDKGVQIPKEIGPGPQNPMGKYALRTSLWSYLIHGTSSPASVGLRSSSGCIRLYPEDIENLFAMVPEGTPVAIVNQPYKAGWQNGKLYLEAHEPLSEDDSSGSKNDLTPMIRAVIGQLQNYSVNIDWLKAIQVAKQHEGIPQVISVGEALPITANAANASANGNMPVSQTVPPVGSPGASPRGAVNAPYDNVSQGPASPKVPAAGSAAAPPSGAVNASQSDQGPSND